MYYIFTCTYGIKSIYIPKNSYSIYNNEHYQRLFQEENVSGIRSRIVQEYKVVSFV